MTIGIDATVRSNKIDEITAAADAGAGAAILLILDGTRPATGGTLTTTLATLTMQDPSFAAASAGVLTANLPIADAAADATGTATWFRVTDSDGNHVCDGDVATSGSDLNLNTTSLTVGVAVDITSMVFTEGNP